MRARAWLRALLFMVLGLWIWSWGSPAKADTRVNLLMNGQPIKGDVAPYIDGNGRTMVPVRFVMEQLKAEVEWLEQERGVVVRRGSTVIKLWIGSRRALVDGKEVWMDTVPVLKGGRTMVPVRFLAENLGGVVDWSSSTRTVTLLLALPVEWEQVEITGD